MSFQPDSPREESTTRQALSKKDPRPALWPRGTKLYLLLCVAGLIVVLVWRPIAGELARRRAVASIPDASRVQLFERILANLQFCKGQSGTALGDFCAAEAKFILDFPECDQECHRIAQPFIAHPTR